MQTFEIGKNQAGQRFDKFLAKYFKNAPQSLIYKQLRNKNITLNKKKAAGNEILKEGDTVESFFSDETFLKFTAAPSSDSYSEKKAGCADPEKKQLYNPSVIYEDENILIIDKPAGMLSQKAKDSDYSVNEWLTEHLLSNGSITPDELKTFKPSVCNRLDRNTSGLLICGKSLIGLQEMTRIIREGLIQKYYVTLAHGKIDKPFKTKGILTKDSKANKSLIQNVSQNDLEANIETDFKPLKVFDNATLLEVNLHTGKPHQIRAQLAFLGHPIFGDKKYGADDKGLRHQILQAYRLVFPSGENLRDGFENLDGKEIVIPYSELLNKELKRIEDR